MTKPRKTSKSKASGRAETKSTASSPNDNQQAIAAIDAGGGHIDQIRDIIFGKQMADYEVRFQQLENRISSQIDALRLETGEKLKAMKDLFQKQNDDLTKRLKEEKSDRGQEEKALSKEIARTEKVLTKAIDALTNQQIKDTQTLGDQLTALSNQLSDELHIQQVETSKNLEQAVRELDDAKLARTALSQMLVEMAGQLSEPST